MADNSSARQLLHEQMQKLQKNHKEKMVVIEEEQGFTRLLI